MSSFDSRKVAFPLLCLLVFADAVISGGIYRWYRDIFVFAAFMLFLLSLAGPESGGKRLLFLFLPAVAAYLSALWTVNLNNTLAQAFFFTGLAFFGFAAASAAGGERKETLLKVFAAAAALVSLYGMYQYFFGLAHTEEFVRQGGLTGEDAVRALRRLGNRRAFSTLMSPNVLACFLATAAPVISALLIKEKNKVLYGFALAAVLAALVLTKSVGGFFALGGGLAVLAVFLFRQGRLGTKTAAALALVLALLAGGAVFAAVNRSGGAFSLSNSAGQRAGYYSAALDISRGHAFLGRGAGSFQVLYLGHKRPGADETRYVHDVFLQYLAEEGLIGVLAVAALFAFFFYNCVRKMRQSPEDALIFAGIASGGAAFLLHNLADFSWYVPETASVFWLLAGISASGGEGGPKQPSKAFRLALAGLAVFFIFFFSMSYYANSLLEGSLAVLGEAGVTSAQAARSTPVPPEAVRLAEGAARVKPYDDGLHAFLAGLYEGRASADGLKPARMAESEYQKAIALNPEYPFHYRDLGILYLRLGDREKAADAFRKALSLYPASDSLKKYLSAAENR